MNIWRKWDRTAFMLAICVLGGLVSGWFLPATQDITMAFAFAQMAMAIVVVIKEGKTIAEHST